LAASHEGSDVAKVFNDWGLTAFVLKYRLPDDTIMIDKLIGPFAGCAKGDSDNKRECSQMEYRSK
jgi:hypothetical protein